MNISLSNLYKYFQTSNLMWCFESNATPCLPKGSFVFWALFHAEFHINVFWKFSTLSTIVDVLKLCVLMLSYKTIQIINKVQFSTFLPRMKTVPKR